MGEPEEKATEKSQSTEPKPTPTQDADDVKETDKMLKPEEIATENGKIEGDDKKSDHKAPKAPVKKEEIARAPENVTVPKVTAQEREVKPKKIPIGGIKMPGFFTKAKPKSDTDAAEDGELLENAGNEAKANEESEKEKKGFFSSLKFKNPFKRQNAEPLDEEKGLTKDDDAARAAAEKQAESEAEKAAQQQQKRGIFEGMRLPNIIQRRLRRNNDIELGNGPNTRAGLASMETLDDSQKDIDKGSDVTDKAANGKEDDLETVKLDNSEEIAKDEKPEEQQKKPLGCLERLQTYNCSVDDWAIIGGIVLFIFLVIIIFAFALSGSPIPKEAPLRDGKFVKAVTLCGYVEGVLEDNAYAFRGVPYAVPPLGERRWKPSEVLNNIDYCWNGTFKAHNSTQHCLQIHGNGTIDGIEDCLTLDVVTPHIRYDNPLPVVVLIGAESLTGDSPGRLRPSTRYARARDVIFVRPNFRIGAYGFLALETLSKSTDPHTSGNYGLFDIITALEWIKENIAHFGGDKNSVTLFGHRAGATLVTVLSTSPKAKGLFARAWVSSGSATFPGRPLAESERSNEEFLKNVGCTNATCLREATNSLLLESVPDTWRKVTWDLPTPDEHLISRHNWLVLDGQILLKHPADVWSKEPGPIKMVIGTTAHESHSEKLYLKHKEWTPELVRNHIEASVIGHKNLTDEVLEKYPQTYQGLVRIISDIRTVCPLLINARNQPAVPFYIVTQIAEKLNISDVDSDITAILGRYEPRTPEQRRYVSAMQQLFYHYVSHGEMKIYESRQGVLEIGQDALLIEDYENCNFWISNDIVPRYGRID